jgi:uncharacterized protein YhdP
MRTTLRNLLRALEILAWAAFFAFATLFLALRYWILPSVENYRADIVAAISRSIGLQVRIGALSTDWQGLRPRLAIADVRVYDRDGREALVLPSVENVVAWRTLIAGELRLHSFLIDGPKLAVRRDAAGHLYVAGIRVSGDPGDGKLTDWLLSQRQILVRGAEIEWLDETRKAPPLLLSALNFRLENDGDEHAIGLSARPPRELGPGLELRARLAGADVRQFAHWSGRMYAELGYTDLAGWRAWVDYPVDVRRGEGAVRLWVTAAGGKLTQATADVELSNVSARLGRDLPVLEIASVSGRVFGRETARGYDFGARRLALVSPVAPPMNGTSFRASWEPASATAPVPRGAVTANLIELAPLARLAEFLPFPADLRAVLAELSPQGNLLDAKFEWAGELPDRATFTGKSRFSGLTMNAWRSIPGFANLSGSVEATEKKGALLLASRRSELDLPKVFPEPRIALEALNGEVGWELGDNALAVRVANLSYANEDLAGVAYGTYRWEGEGPGAVDLTAELSRADGRHTAKYLPLAALMGEGTRDWVARAVRDGQARDVKLRLKGDLRDFPFQDPEKGIFQVSALISGGVLDYATGWPRLERIEGGLLFDRDRLEVVGRSGAILGARVSDVRVALPSLRAAGPRLNVEGNVEGPTAAFLEFIRDSPVSRMIDGVTDSMASIGRGRLRLRLELPLADLDKTRVAGEYQFAANNLSLGARLPAIERAAGRVSFTESTVTVSDVRGQLLGGDVRISGGSRDGAVALQAEGRATAEGLRALTDHPWRHRFAGAARYVATATVREGRRQLSVESTLEGLSSALPSPLAKSAAEALPLRVDVVPGEGRDRISVSLGPPSGRIVAAEILRAAAPSAGPAPAAPSPQGQRSPPAQGERATPLQGERAPPLQGERAPPLQVQRALVMLNPLPGEALRMPDRRGLTLRGTLPALDLERWLPLFAEIAPVPGASAAPDESLSYDLRVGVLDALGKRMRSVTLAGVADAGGWSASIGTAEFAGDLVYRGEGSGRLVARFARFMLPEDAPTARPGERLKDLPALDVVADEFTHRGRRLGRVEVQARHEGSDWRVDKLSVTNADAALAGSGLWRQGEGSRVSLAFKLDVSDIGRFMDRLGYPEHLKAGRGRLEGSLAWNGDPVNIDYATLGGNLQMQAEDGQFLEIEPGIGKLVSLMSLQMLPRRAAGDFRDVFSKGFQFDRITSSMDIARGVMAVKDFHMNGPAADVNMTGQIDLALETQTLQVRITPQLGDTASTVVGLVNPVAGVAALIAGRLIKNPLGKLFAFDYTITGTWTDPKVEKVVPPVQSSVIQEGGGIPR